MAMSKQKERMRGRLNQGMLAFVLREGIINIGLKLGVLYLLVSFFITFRANINAFLDPHEMRTTLLYLIVIMVIGIYWGFMWYFILVAEKKREEASETRKEAQKKLVKKTE